MILVKQRSQSHIYENPSVSFSDLENHNMSDVRLNEELLKRYINDPMGMDEEIRKKFDIPKNRYYTISTWPEKVAGYLYIDMKRTREVSAKKISKSDQK